MKKLARIFALALVLLALGNVTAAAVTIPDPDPVLLYVTDTAGVLSAETENYIATRNDALYAQTGAQFAVLTIDSLPAGHDSESYCYEVFNAWGIGDAEKDNGLLLLLVPDEGKFWMVTGTGLQSHLTGGTLSDLMDTYLAEDFDDGYYDQGVLALFDAVWEKLEDIYGPIDTQLAPVEPDYDYDYDHNYGYEDDEDDTLALIVGIIVVVVIIIIVANATRPGKRYYSGRTTPPPSTGAAPYYRSYRYSNPKRRPPPGNYHGGFGGYGSRPYGGYSNRPFGGFGGFGGSRPSGGYSRPSGSSRPSRPSGSFSRPSGSSRPSSPSRSFGGGRSHGGGGGRR